MVSPGTVAASANADDLTLVRSEVGKVLRQSPSWRELSDDQRRDFARNMVKVASYLASDPGWLDSPPPPGSEAVAGALGPVDDLRKRLAGAPGQVGADFEAGALRQGVEEFRNLVRTVDFPEFVSGLIQGVFQAIVDASIQQMEAYGELLAATAKTVDQFAADHISDDQVREQVANRFPSLVRIERSEESGGRRLAAAEDAEDASALQQFTNSTERIDLSSDDGERRFIAAAKLEMARQRQKLMALMVLLGINRIVVTNGRINAKVVFDIRASDYAQRQARAAMTDRSEREALAVSGMAMPWGAAGGYARSRHVATVSSSVDDSSESKAEMKARLSGEVRVNFRSETLPPERMLDALQYEQINYMATAGAPQQAGAPAPAGGSTRP